MPDTVEVTNAGLPVVAPHAASSMSKTGSAVRPPDDTVGPDRGRPPGQRVRREHSRPEDRRLEPAVAMSRSIPAWSTAIGFGCWKKGCGVWCGDERRRPAARGSRDARQRAGAVAGGRALRNRTGKHQIRLHGHVRATRMESASAAECHGSVVLPTLRMNLLSKANEISGSQTGSQRRQTPGDTRRRLATINPASWHFRRRQATPRDSKIASYKRGVAGSNPAPTRSEGCLCFLARVGPGQRLT